MSDAFKISDAVRLRQFVLEQLLRASASIKGWEVRNGADLLVEAEVVERWLRTGKKEIPTASRPAAAGSRGTKRKKPK